MGPKHLPATPTDMHVEQNLKANAMSLLTSKIRDDEGQNLFNVKYIAVTWQIFCCFFVTRRFYHKVIYLISTCTWVYDSKEGWLSFKYKQQILVA